MKRKSLILGMALFAMTLFTVFCCGQDVQAEENKSLQKVSDEVKIEKLEVDAFKARTAKAVESLNVNTILKQGDIKPERNAYAFETSYNGSVSDVTVRIPVVPKHSGLMYIDVGVLGYNSGITATVPIDFYMALVDSNSLGVGELGDGLRVEDDGVIYTTTGYMIPVTAGKTYYVDVYATSYEDAVVYFEMCATVYTTITRTLPNKTEVIASGVNRDGDVATTYFKIKPSTTGSLSVTLKEYGFNSQDYEDYVLSPSNGYVTLCDKNKKALSTKVIYDTSNKAARAYFGVKKGTTYYVKVTQCLGDAEANWKYGIKYSVTARTDRAIGTQSKAKTLKRTAAATQTLFIASTSKSTDWYKFTVPSSGKAKLRMDTSAIKSGNLYMAIYKGSKRVSETLTFSQTKGTSGGFDLSGAKGTYYIKVVKSEKASGKYSIRYVK